MPTVTVSPADLQKVVDDVNQNVSERSRETQVLLRGALAGATMNLLGPAGTGKSLTLRLLSERITGARYFSKAIHAQMPADAIIGGYDMPKFAETGKFERKVDGYAPTAHVVFLDEITRANGPTLDALLPLLNSEERLYEANGGMKRADALFVGTASNYMPEPDDAHLGAFVDRITLMLFIDYVKADSSFEEMVVRHHARNTNPSAPVTVSLDQFVEAQRLVRAVAPTEVFLKAYSKLRRASRDEGLMVSDRRFVELTKVARANAWLAGRSELNESDIVSVEEGLWRDPEDRKVARSLMLPFQSPILQDVARRRAEAEPLLAELDAFKPQVEAAGEKITPDLVGVAMTLSRKLGEVNKRTAQLAGEAEKQQVAVPDLNALKSELAAAKSWLIDNYLPAAWPEA